MDSKVDSREAIQRIARSALGRYPSEELLSERESKEIALRTGQEAGDLQQFLEQAHELLRMGAQATSWNDEQLESFALVTDWIHLSFHIAAELQIEGPNVAAKEASSTVFDCATEREKCLQRLECTKTTWPCQCCAPCNLAFLACVYDAVRGKQALKTVAE